jgi:ribosome-binding protein aMBF1 (putative translation factor)
MDNDKFITVPIVGDVGEDGVRAQRQKPVKVPDVGRLIRSAREARGISARSIGNAIGSRTYLKMLETGQSSPTINKLAMLAHLMGYQLRIAFEKVE